MWNKGISKIGYNNWFKNLPKGNKIKESVKQIYV